MSGTVEDKGGMLKLADGLWIVLVSLLLLFATYVSAGRLLTGMVSSYQSPLLAALSEQLPVHLEARAVEARWRGFRPQLVFHGLSLRESPGAASAVTLEAGRATIDVWASLRSGSLRVNRAQLAGLDLRGELTGEGDFRLLGLGRSPNGSGAWVEELLLDLERVVLRDNRLHLRLPDGSVQLLSLDLSLLRDGSRRQLRAELQTVRGTAVTLLADGLGNPFDTAEYSGDVYAQLQVRDLRGLASWWPGDRDLPVDLDGSAELEVWLGLKSGDPRLDVRFDAADLRVSGHGSRAWRLPFDQLAGQARVRRLDRGWQLQVGDLHLRQGALDQHLSALSVALHGDSAQLSAQGLRLEFLRLLAGPDSPLPEGLGEALETLQPAGLLPVFRLRLDDLSRAGESWSVSGRFEGLALNSWRGAPGVEGAAGELHLRAGHGRVVLDSPDVALNFPTVYREPLQWRQLAGAIDLHWDGDWLRLSSGVLSATGEEGTARALFGLDVPLRRGLGDVDMQLLVGVESIDPRYRDKYLPYILPDSLLTWLSDSLRAGEVRKGGFVWRGSLRPGARDARTVQLFFDVADARLRFDPRWPMLSALSGTLVIDDSRVSLWSEQAQLFDSKVARLSAETWRSADDELRLLVSATLAGPASDGLRLLRESPLAEPLGGALDAWRGSGELTADLRLNLPLAPGPRPAEVGVAVNLDDVALELRPGGLDLHGLSGTLRYASGNGFAGETLRATLWGEPLTFAVQQARGSPDTFVPGPVQLEMASRVNMASLADWLGFPGGLPAEGGAEVRGSLSFQSGARPKLELRSALRGVQLELPFPFDKPPEAALPLALSAELGGESVPLDLQLGRLLDARLSLRGGRAEAASLAFRDRPLPLLPGLLRVSGQLPEFRLAAWQALLAGGMADRASPPPTVSGNAAPAGQTSGPSGQASALQPRVEALQLGTLIALGRDWRDVLVDLRRQPDAWLLDLEAAGFQGRLRLPEGLGAAQLTLDSLELAVLAGGGPPGDEPEPGQWQSLPDIEVEILQLYRRGRAFGELAFDLGFADDGVHVRQLRGSVPGLTLAPGQPASLHWGSEGTRLQAGLRVGNLGETLAALDYQRILETGGGALGLDLRWPGSPGGFALARSEGALRIDLRDGRFLNAPASASGTLRVVSILNLADLIQRLSLNQVFESGISFDRLQGDMLLGEGRLRVPELELAGAGSALVFRGESLFAERSLSGELVATLPVASNLPWVAALAGGLPAAAGVYVVSKVFEKQVSQLSSAVYRLGGSWDDPQLRLDRIFDLEQRAQSSQESPEETASPADSSRQ